MRLAVVVVFLGLLTACSAVAPTYLDPEVKDQVPGAYALSIERGRHMGVDNIPLVIFVDGVGVAHVGGGQAITLYLDAGRYIVGVAPKTLAEDGPVSSVVVDVSATSQPILRTNVSAWGWNGWKIGRVGE